MATYPANATVAAIFAGDPSGANAPNAHSPLPWLPNQVSEVGTIVLQENIPPVTVETYAAQAIEQEAGTFDFFEDFHVVPRAFDFGNLLSDQSEPIEVFSAFRHQTREWTAWINNAGAGVELGGEPSLPAQVEPLTGFQMTLDVSAIGPPFVDTTLDFVFDLGTAYVPIVIQRIVLWGLEPELPYSELLRFLTDILPARAGAEQRMSLRKNPRQVFRYRYLLEEGATRQILENLLFEWHTHAFGVPVWMDDSLLTVAATAGNTTITVDGTSFRDYRVGGLAVVFTSQSVFDVLTIASKTSTTITFDSPLLNNYAVGTLVMPLLACYAQPTIQGARWPMGLSQMSIDFESSQNDVDLADVSAFATYNGKVLLDRFNSVLGQTSPETFMQDAVRIDNETGLPQIEQMWDRHKRGSYLALHAAGRQEVWELRGLAHALKGRKTSLYVPRHQDDLLVTASLLNGANTMEVANYGYSQFVQARQPKNVIRISFNDGSPALVRTITNSQSLTPTTEELELDLTWPSTFAASAVARVEYVEKLRLDSDEIELSFDIGARTAHLTAPAKVVFD
jgi:hypothetical protein